MREIFAVDGAEMSCLRWPAPDLPTLLFSHATGFNAETYRSLLAPLASSFDILAPDARGHGLSTLPASTVRAQDWVVFRDDLAALMTPLESRTIILTGHSMGASVSLMLAALMPSRVRALVLIEPVLLDPQAPVTPNRLALRAAQRRSTFPSRDAAFETYRGRGIFASWADEVIRDYLAGGMLPCAEGGVRLACSPEWEADIYRGAPIDVARLAAQTVCPLTIIHAISGSTASPPQLDRIRKLKPDTRVICVENASHFLPIEQPGRVREEVLRAAHLPVCSD